MTESLSMDALESLLEMWYDHPGGDLAQTTLNRYRGAIKRFFAWFTVAEQRSPSLLDLHPISIVGYRETLKQTETSSTINIHLCALRTWCGWLIDHDYLDINPVQKVKLMGRTLPSAPKALSSAQINALLRQVQRTRNSARNTAILQILLQTGMRIGECTHLTWADVTLGERHGYVLIRMGKGNKQRSVPLNDSVRHALATYASSILAVEPSVKAVVTAWPNIHTPQYREPLWRSERGQALSIREISHMIHHLVRNCAARGLVPLETTPHSLRHTFATRYLARHPYDLVGLARILGHTSITTTQIYIQPTEAQIAEKIAMIDLNAYSY